MGVVLPQDDVVPDQRVSGGRLFIENGRDFYTKVMSNGVGVIVRGKMTKYLIIFTRQTVLAFIFT